MPADRIVGSPYVSIGLLHKLRLAVPEPCRMTRMMWPASIQRLPSKWLLLAHISSMLSSTKPVIQYFRALLSPGFFIDFLYCTILYYTILYSNILYSNIL